MKKFILPFLFLLLTSCGTTYTVSTYYDPPPVQWVNVYNFDRIHFLYTNYPQWVWTNYYQHPYFIQYRNDCIRRGIYTQPYRYNYTYSRPQTRYTPVPRPVVRENSGRSNYTYRNQPTTRTYSRNNYTPSRQTTPNVRHSTASPSMRSAPTRSPSRRGGGRVNN